MVMQLREKDILGCLPLLASVLGNTYGVHVRIGGSDACTDGNMIQLPSLPVDCGEELLLLVRGFIDHESAHIRYTDFKAFRVCPACILLYKFSPKDTGQSKVK